MSRTGFTAALTLLLLAACAPREVNPRVRLRGNELFMMGKYEQAAGHYEAHLSARPDDPDRAEILVMAGKCRLAANQVDRAITHFDAALAASPDPRVRFEASFRRGHANRVRGRAYEAVGDLRRAASESVSVRKGVITDDEFHYEFALALYHAGSWSEGAVEMAKVDPSGPLGREARTRTGLKGFTVQLGAFKDAVNARRAAARFRAQVRTLTGSEPLFLVEVGPYARLEDARAQVAHYKANGSPDAFVLP